MKKWMPQEVGFTWWYKRYLKNLVINFYYRQMQKGQVRRFLADRIWGRDLLYSFFFPSARIQPGYILGYLARMKRPIFSMKLGTDTSWFSACPFRLFWRIFGEWKPLPSLPSLPRLSLSEGRWLLTHGPLIPSPAHQPHLLKLNPMHSTGS